MRRSRRRRSIHRDIIQQPHWSRAGRKCFGSTPDCLSGRAGSTPARLAMILVNQGVTLHICKHHHHHTQEARCHQTSWRFQLSRAS